MALIIATLIGLGAFIPQANWRWRGPVSIVLGIAITVLELMAINLVLDLRTYRPGNFERAMSAFLIFSFLWWQLSTYVLGLHRFVPPFLWLNFLVLSVCVSILAGLAVISGLVAIGQAARRAMNPSVARSPSETSWEGLDQRIGIAVALAVFAFAATGSALVVGPRRFYSEPAAISSLRTINSAQAWYAASCAGGGYATNLADLVKAHSGGYGFLPPDLAESGGSRHGYVITMRAAPGPSTTG